MTLAPPQAITFDFWNTLAYEPAGYLRGLRFEAVRDACRRLGLDHPDEHLHEHLAAAGAVHETAWTSGQPFHPRQSAEHLADALGPELAEQDRAVLLSAYLDSSAGCALHLAPNIGETLATLRAAGIRLAIVCDVGLTGSALLRDFLDRSDLLEHFSGWAFSDEVGAFKPAPAIFHAALDGIAPERAIHIGDLRRTDIAGAAALGMTTIRYRGIADDDGDGPEADHVIDDHRDLAKLIGLDASTAPR